jgi:hydrogenase maturation protein HypF
VRVGFVVRGTVQGVGFRPFVRRTATAHRLSGWVKNGRSGVRIEVQGDERSVAAFAWALAHELPEPAAIAALERELLTDRDDDPDGEGPFRILPSEETEPPAPVLPPDLATCARCWDDVRTHTDRRFGYPFTNCTSCGPRYSIVRALPYDRARTTMRSFQMCADCTREYEALDDRRHHAQPIACPRCGPTLEWLDRAGRVLARRGDALHEASAAIARGAIVALRGIGGYQLLCDATRGDVVARLRERKLRPTKPFAVMFADLGQLLESARVSPEERAILASPCAPIVLVPRHGGGPVAEEVAPRSPDLGAMLPNTPLHGLLLASVGLPLVCTSGNRSEEPIAIDTSEALARLHDIADGYLSHDRLIERPLDDSVVRATPKRTLVVRRARGFVPKSVGHIDERASVLAMGAHLKSTVTLGHRGVLVPSQHLGDLDSPLARDLLRATAEDIVEFFGARPALVACDLHPDYASTGIAGELAKRWGAPLLRVQHHHAHIAACMAERGLDRPVLGLAWDGTGLGTDGTIWGGEALVCRGARFDRFAHLRPFPLSGGDRAARDPRRCAIGLIAEADPSSLESWATRWFGRDANLHVAALERRLHAAPCSSVGRLFDAVAALVGLERPATFEGESAMALERLARAAPPDGAYPLPLARSPNGPLVADTRPLVLAISDDARRSVDADRVARRFHSALVQLGVAIAEHAGIPDVVLSGGCFQNALLLEGLEARLLEAGFVVHVPTEVPVNDGGISVGQAWIAAQMTNAPHLGPEAPIKKR